MEVLFDILTHPVTSALLAIAGLVLAVYSIIEGRRRYKSIHYRVSEYPYQRIWDEHRVALNVAVWNSSSLPITSQDIADTICLRTCNGSPFSNAYIFFHSNPLNRVVLNDNTADRARLEIRFSYLDPKDGAVVVVEFKGASTENVSVSGAIVGGGRPARDGPYSTLTLSGIFGSVLLFSWLVFFAGLFSEQIYVRGLLMILGVLLYPVAVGPLLTRVRKRKLPRQLLVAFENPPSMLGSAQTFT